MADAYIRVHDPESGSYYKVKIKDQGDGTYALAATGAANSGVDIGDVDVLSIAAGETHVGEVGGRVAVVAVTPTITAGAYHAGDVIGGIITLTGAARVSGGGTTLTRLSVLDAANQKAQIEALFFNANPASSTFTDNAAPVIHASDETKYISKLTLFASDYLTVGAKAVACLTNLGLAVVPSGSANLFMVLIVPGTPTYAATTDLKLTLAFYQE